MDIFWHQGTEWHHGNTLECMNLPGHVISLVGGGGKTTLLFHLAEFFQSKGLRTAVITTTKIFRPNRVCADQSQCEAAWAAGAYAICGEDAPGGKLSAPAPDLLEWLLVRSEILLAEADGARRMACKMPAEHEPVLLPQTDTVIGVMGLDVLGQPVGDVCFRPERICELLGCTMEHRLTPDDLASILLSPTGTRKGVETRHYYIVLNKCDDPFRLAGGQAVAAHLETLGQTQNFLTRFR